MSNQLHNSLHALSQTWLGIPGWGWILIIIVALIVIVWGALRS